MARHTPSIPPADESLPKGPLLKIPVPKEKMKSGDRKEPSVLQGWRDPYWKSYTSWYLHEARDIYLRQVVGGGVMEETVNGKRIKYQISRYDKEQLTIQYNKIREMAERYDQARVNRNRDQARDLSALIFALVIELTEGESASALKAATKAGEEVDLSEAYMRGFNTLSKKRKEEHSLRNALGFTQSCNKAARKDTFKMITSWVDCVDRHDPIFWLYGEQGCGKTVLTHCFGETCSTLDCLAASFLFFSHQKTTRASLIQTFVAHFITDVAEYLGGCFPDMLGRIATPVIGPKDEHVDRFFSLSLIDQLRTTFIPAWNELPEEGRKPLLVVIDGIEHLEKAAQPLLFQFINYAVENLPVAFFISSSPEPYITMQLEKGPLREKVRSKELPKYDPTYWREKQYDEKDVEQYDDSEQLTPRALNFPDFS